MPCDAREADRFAAHAPVIIAASRPIQEVRSQMMHDMAGMMWGMGLVWFIVIIVLVLVTAALVKYLFFR